MKIWIVGILTVLNLAVTSIGQSKPISKENKVAIVGDSLYQSNIKKSRLYGVYIPRDVDDAMMQLMKLTNEEARRPMLTVSEDTIARKLHFGLGRWMEYNWNFAEGSRISHLLRLQGLEYTEDMTRFMLITFHRHISGKKLDSEKLIEQIKERRKNIIEKDMGKNEIISIDTIQKQKPK